MQRRRISKPCLGSSESEAARRPGNVPTANGTEPLPRDHGIEKFGRVRKRGVHLIESFIGEIKVIIDNS